MLAENIETVQDIEFENGELRRKLQIANRAVDKLRNQGERLQMKIELMQAEIIRLGGSW
jgi:predicted nuclease with TOPRIM domain